MNYIKIRDSLRSGDIILFRGRGLISLIVRGASSLGRCKDNRHPKILMLCLVALLFGGCISASYNPNTKDVKYSRLGNMEASGIVVVIDPNGAMRVEVASEKNTGLEAVMELLKSAFQEGLKAGLAAR